MGLFFPLEDTMEWNEKLKEALDVVTTKVKEKTKKLIEADDRPENWYVGFKVGKGKWQSVEKR
jgi:hypothetical protein